MVQEYWDPLWDALNEIVQNYQNMKIVNIIGGLGNQMFQYAFALALKEQNNGEDVFIDTQHFHTLFFNKYKNTNLHNGFELHKVFKELKVPIADWKKLIKVTYYIPNFILSRVARRVLPKRKSEFIEMKRFAYDSLVFERKGNCYYEGYWQSINYYLPIKDKIIKEFDFGCPNAYNKNILKKINESETVGMHIRRGDYLYIPEFQGLCDLDYYQRAIKEIQVTNRKITYLIFSNDIKWCKENISPLVGKNEIIFVTENKGINSCWDMFLMSQCDNLVIANSSFSWWGAFLNKRAKKIIAPIRWKNTEQNIDLFDPTWIRL